MVIEQRRGDNYVAGTRFEPLCGIVCCDAATDLQAPGPCAQSLARGLTIARSETDHVTTFERIVAVVSGIPRGIVLGDEILARSGTVIAQRATDDLFHLAVVQVNAWSEFCHRVPRTNHYAERNSSTK